MLKNVVADVTSEFTGGFRRLQNTKPSTESLDNQDIDPLILKFRKYCEHECDKAKSKNNACISTCEKREMLKHNEYSTLKD